jgi:hypothetical protein
MSAPITNQVTMAQQVSDHLLTDLVGNWFLYAMSMFVELSVVLITCTFMWHAAASLRRNRGFTHRTDPVNLHKWKYLLLSLTIFMRAVMDAIMLLTWDEVQWSTFEYMVTTDRILTIIALIPFLG